MKKNMLKFTEEFNLMKNYNVNSDKGCIIEVHVEYPKTTCIFNYHSSQKEWKLMWYKCDKLVCSLYDKKISC